jgi:hypothetical protein
MGHRRTFAQIGQVKLQLHRFNMDDEDRELHDHPWWALSMILVGGYVEERRVGERGNETRWKVFPPGSVNVIRPTTQHRVKLVDRCCWTLIVTGPKVRDWGFWRRETDEWIPWMEFVERRQREYEASDHSGQFEGLSQFEDLI